MTSPAPAPRPQVMTWAPSQTGPCAACHRPCARYGAPANPLCEACKAARQAQYGA
ncbi:hypothetical protein ABZ934_31495 [Streptomyces sp. NPDC046557]|uniref:hypothetical protein n=1 Tax=Streptomyces sp. NPDC046557 TaxID=3155372 RepID=UPI0033F5B3BB